MQNYWQAIAKIISDNKLSINFFDNLTMGVLVHTFNNYLNDYQLWKWIIIMPDLNNLAKTPFYITQEDLGNQKLASLFTTKLIAKKMANKWEANLTIAITGDKNLNTTNKSTYYLVILLWAEIYEYQITIDLQNSHEVNYFLLETKFLQILYQILNPDKHA